MQAVRIVLYGQVGDGMGRRGSMARDGIEWGLRGVEEIRGPEPQLTKSNQYSRWRLRVQSGFSTYSYFIYLPYAS